MIGHHAKRHKTNGMFFQGLDQDTLKSFVVAVFLKERQARDGPIQRMINVTTKSGAGLAGHASMVAGTHRIVNKTVRVPFVRRGKASVFSGCNSHPATGRSSR